MQTATWSGKFEDLRDYKQIPAETLHELVRYVLEGRRPGGFLRAVLCDSLQKSFRYGDLPNLKALWAITTWLYNRAPQDCFGSETIYFQWGGLKERFTGDQPTIERLIEEWKAHALKGTVLDGR